MDDYRLMCEPDNLRRAYRWLQSNPDAVYKTYFRDAYSAYAASSKLNLHRLRRLLLRHAYKPTHGVKVYLPKPSGSLRPLTLITVDDQVIYQACLNLIADRLTPRIRKRYSKTIFGHLYAGRSSQFFYRKWQDGYRGYSRSVLRNIESGNRFVANFDMASFYDSIDHRVLQHFLTTIAVDKELSDFLLECLRTWTSYTWHAGHEPIYHGHGIPQGPLSSGFLSEVVLSYIDERATKGADGKRYLRFVDDIKVFAKSEAPLRQKLITLDLASKEIGLFPQTAKINIREVENPAEEIRSISIPVEPALVPPIKAERLRKRLLNLTKNGKVADKTRFKYMLAQAIPHGKLNARLLKVLQSQPEYAGTIARYFARYPVLPKSVAKGILQVLRGHEIYHAVNAELLFSTLDNMQEPERSECATYCFERLFVPSKRPRPQPSFKAGLIAWTLRYRNPRFADLRSLILTERDWWVVKSIFAHISEGHYGRASYAALLNESIRLTHNDAARCAAIKMIEDDIAVLGSIKDINEAAKVVLFAAGRIRSIGRSPSVLPEVLAKVLGQPFSSYEWRRLLGARHQRAELAAFNVQKNFEANIDACLVGLDSLCDLIFEALWGVFQPGVAYGAYGGMLKAGIMTTNVPMTTLAFEKLHTLRLQSMTAHPRMRATGKATRRLRWKDFYSVRPHIIAAVKEIVTVPI